MPDLTPPEKLIALAISHPEAAAAVAHLGPDIFQDFIPIVSKIIQHQQSGKLLSKPAFKIALELDGATPAAVAAQSSLYDRLHFAAPALDDLPTLTAAATADAKQAKTAAAVVRFQRDLQHDPKTARRRAAEALLAVDYDDIGSGTPDDLFSAPVNIPITRDQLPPLITTIADALATRTAAATGAKHILSAAAIVAAAVGKRATFHNWGTDYWLSLAVVILDASGQNKTGLYNTIAAIVADILPTHQPATSTVEAFVENFCDFVPPDKKRTPEETRNLKKQAYDHQHENQHGQMVLVDEFRAFLATMVPTEQAVRNGQIFCRILDGQPVEMGTITSGTRILGCTPFTIIGFSQADAWNGEVRTVALQSGGMAGRIIPLNCLRFGIEGYTGKTVDVATARAALSGLIGKLESPWGAEGTLEPIDPTAAIHIVFGEQGEDRLRDAKQWFRGLPFATYAAENNPQEFALLESKILIQSAKLAAIFAIAAATTDPQPLRSGIDAARWLRAAYSMVGIAHLTNVYHDVMLTEQGEKMAKITSIIRRKGKVSRREIVRFSNFKPHEVDAYIRLLTESGEIVSRPDGKTTRYQIRGG